MSDRVALFVAFLFLFLIVLDLLANNGQAIFFLSKKGMGLIEWMAFWR